VEENEMSAALFAERKNAIRMKNKKKFMSPEIQKAWSPQKGHPPVFHPFPRYVLNYSSRNTNRNLIFVFLHFLN
jgi:hypothetical protein